MKNILKIDISTYFLFLFSLLAGYIKETIIIFIIVIIHELGHVICFKVFKIKVLKVVLYPFGGMTYIEKRLHERIYKDIICNLGGVLFQVILSSIMLVLYRSNLIGINLYKLFSFYNKIILIFNLLPIIPLDGSKLLFSLLSMFLSFRSSYRWMMVIGFISFILLVVVNKNNDIFIYGFLLYRFIELAREYKYIINKFYLERIMYDNYYNGIVNDKDDIKDLRIDKYYYFYDDKRYINEKDYIKKLMYRE